MEHRARHTPRAAAFAAAAIFAVAQAAYADWPTLAANPARTSAVIEEVRGAVKAAWYRPIEPYINYKVQVIAADGRLFVTTARGLYCLDADTGAVLWVYATGVPLGHSPTYADGTLYVGSYDRTVHAVDAVTGRRVATWNPFVALAGFETNPLVVNGRVYAGNRDGYFYCLDATTGALHWRFKTGAAIRNSAAIDAGRVIYFASEDLHGYAVRDLGASAQLVWKSSKLLGDTFSTYWAVVYKDWVVFSGGMGYFYPPPDATGIQLPWDEKNDIDADLTLSTGTEPGDWAPGTVTLDASPILEYYERKPYRRRVFVLNRADGREYTFDSDGDGRLEYAPFTFSGATQSGPKYPPVVGHDGVLYTSIDTVATAGLWTPLSALAGWKVGTRHISRVMDWGGKQQQAADEPMAFSIGGRLAYWNLCGDRESGSFDLSVPFGRPDRWWLYWAYAERFRLFPDYQPMYHADDIDGWGVYGGPDGVYGKHGAQNPWVPYRGKLYRIMGNAVVAVSTTGTASGPLPLARTVVVGETLRPPSPSDLRARLEEEVRAMIAAGHLKPGLFRANIGDDMLNGNGESAMDQGLYYFSTPGETIAALVNALPQLSPALQADTRDYIRAEMARFPIDTYAHVGHVEGVSRQAAVVPPDQEAGFAIGKQTNVVNNYPWRFPMTAFYAAWKYVQVWPEEAPRLHAALGPKLTVPCALSDDDLVDGLQALNAYIAGYRGFLELERVAGQRESPDVRREYERLVRLRVASFSLDLSYHPPEKWRNMVMARHFLYMVPELAEELRQSRLVETERLVNRIDAVTPYWFVAGGDATNREGTHQVLYEAAIFQAHAMILQKSYTNLVKYLDAPAFPVGDLHYLNNLVAVLETTAAPAVPGGVRAR